MSFLLIIPLVVFSLPIVDLLYHRIRDRFSKYQVGTTFCLKEDTEMLFEVTGVDKNYIYVRWVKGDRAPTFFTRQFVLDDTMIVNKNIVAVEKLLGIL